MFRRLLIAVGALTALTAVPVAYAAGLFNGYPVGNGASYCSGASGYPTGATTPGVTNTPNACNSTVPAGPALTGNEYYPADTATPGSLTQTAPSTILVPGTAVAGSTFATPRNLLGNSQLLGTQVNGTNTVTCATTSAPTTAAISADRFECDANVGSGAGRTAIVTSSPTPPTGFTNVMKVFRTSGALTQPICVWQAVPTPQSTQLAGQTVTFSAQIAALAGLSADNGNTMSMVIISGTGTDQGFNGSWTASPAITPAWTGIATVANVTQNVTTTFARYSVTAALASTVTEVGVGLCFTPTATGAGATDGFAWTGAQLEKGASASVFEVKPRQADIADNEQFIYAINEGAATVTRAMCMASSTTLAICGLKFPVPMYKTPAMGYSTGFATATTTAGSTLGACTTLRTSTLVAGNGPSSEGVLVDCVATTVPAAGSADYLADNGGTGVITAWTGL